MQLDYSILIILLNQWIRDPRFRFLGQFQHYAMKMIEYNVDVAKGAKNDYIEGKLVGDGAMRAYRMGMVYFLMPAIASAVTGIEWGNMVENATATRLQQMYTLFTGEDEEIKKAFYGRGPLLGSLGAPLFSDLIKMGQIMEWYDMDEDSKLGLINMETSLLNAEGNLEKGQAALEQINIDKRGKVVDSMLKSNQINSSVKTTILNGAINTAIANQTNETNLQKLKDARVIGQKNLELQGLIASDNFYINLAKNDLGYKQLKAELKKSLAIFSHAPLTPLLFIAATIFSISAGLTSLDVMYLKRLAFTLASVTQLPSFKSLNNFVTEPLLKGFS